MAKILNRIGEVYKNNDGLEMIIIEYMNNKEVTVEFQSGYKKTTNMSTILRGGIRDNFIAEAKRQKQSEDLRIRREIKIRKQCEQRHKRISRIEEKKLKKMQEEDQKRLDKVPKQWAIGVRQIIRSYDKTVHNIGYCGNADKALPYYTKAYELWRGLFRRCYSGDGKDDSYLVSVQVCKRWHSLELFINDLPNIIGFDLWLSRHDMQLDKDLLSNEKVYAPSTCIFLTSRQNKRLQNKELLQLTRDRISNGLVEWIPSSKLFIEHKEQTWSEFISNNT